MRDRDLDRDLSLARLLASLSGPPSVDELGAAVCRLSCRHLGVDAAALFVGDSPAELFGMFGFAAAPPHGVLASLAPADVTRLRAWAAEAGYRRVDLAPLGVAKPAGVLALFTNAAAALDAAALELLGEAVARALEHAQLVRADRLRALGDLARDVAHDFNNALNAILGQTGVLTALVADRADAAAALDRLRGIALDGAAAIRRVQELTGQRRDRDFDRVDLARVVDAVSGELRARAPAGIRVEVTVAAPQVVAGDVEELHELLRAVGDNALEAMSTGGVLTIDLRAAGDDAVVVTVSDDGTGMAPAVKQRALDPFFTTRGARKKGLGLALAAGLVQRYGGRLELDSAPGRGTRVRIQLPAAAAPPADHTAAELSAAPGPVEPAGDHVAPAFRRVLLVEDDADNREAMASLLALGGFDVTGAECGVAAVRAFRDGAFDVVLTDLGLPDMDGWQVAGEIKRASPAVPIALITGWGLNLERDEIRRRGIDLLIKKPLDPRVFLGQIENLLQAGARKPSA